MSEKMNSGSSEQMVNENVSPVDPVTEGRSFDPVITKISKPLKPQGVHAGVTVKVSGNF
jgi:hypothetical protein